MSVNVGIDVHRKRSRVAVVTEEARVQLNKSTENGTEPLLRLIGDLPPGTPGGVRGRVRLGLAGPTARGLRLRGALGAPAAAQGHRLSALKNDKVDAAISAQLLRTDLLPEAWIAPAEVWQLRVLLQHRARTGERG